MRKKKEGVEENPVTVANKVAGLFLIWCAVWFTAALVAIILLVIGFIHNIV